MAGQEILHEAVNQDARVKELTEENELLFEQLHVVQEELEKYYHKLKECEQRKGAAVASSPLSLASLDPRLSETLAENQKLRTLVAQQKLALRVETQNSLPSRLGDMLIKGVSSTGAFLALPGKLRKMWKALEQTTPPSELGGKSFQKVIDAYSAGGAEAVEKLLDSVFISHPMRANAYTALARHLMLIDVQKAAEFAHRAYETDPRPYRFKWLAFRMHDAEDPITADAMLDLLPADITMSESEQRQVMRIRHESTQLRKKNAEKDANVQKQKNTENQNIVQLTKQVEELRREAERLRQQQKELQNTADVRQADLKATQANLTEQKALTERRDAEVLALSSAQAELQALADGYKAEIDALQESLAEQKSLAERRDAEVLALSAAQTELQALADGYKAEADTLQTRLMVQEQLANERKTDMDRLNAVIDEMSKLCQMDIKLMAAQQTEIVSSVSSCNSILVSSFENQVADLERVRKSVQSYCKNEIDKALQQMVAYSGLSEYFESGKSPKVTPWKRGWAASPDFILWLVELIDQNNYDLILEFGSGITTLYTAKTLDVQAEKGASEKNVNVFVFDHLEKFYLQTQTLLSSAGLSKRANVIHAPLQDYVSPDGTAYQYYSCQKDLAELSIQYKSANSRILVIVDGPPGATNKNARYPAFPLVMKYFAPAQIDFLLDDYIREDEKELARMWQTACATAGIEYEVIEKQLEKEALLLRIAPAYAEVK